MSKKDNTKELRKALYDYVDKWFDDMRINCVDSVGQCERVILNAQEFIEGMFEIMRDDNYEDEI